MQGQEALIEVQVRRQETLPDVPVRSQEMDQKLRRKVKKLSWRFR
jgi:hypothetical protein